MAISSPEVLFFQVVEECTAGTISKEQALQRLDTRYKSVHKDIKKELGEDHISFCCYVPCDLDEWIKICDGAERNKPPDSKWKNSHNTIQKVIEKVTTKYKENELNTENVESEATADVYKEVFHIQALCRENKEIKELYEKYKVEIEHLPNIEIWQFSEIELKNNRNIHLPISIKNENVDKVLDILIKATQIVFHEGKATRVDKKLPDEYWVRTSVKNVEKFLIEKQMSGEIDITDIQGFMEAYLKGKQGGCIANSFKTERSMKRKQQ